MEGQSGLLVITGGSGIGKTYALMQMLHEAITRGIPAFYRMVQDFYGSNTVGDFFEEKVRRLWGEGDIIVFLDNIRDGDQQDLAVIADFLELLSRSSSEDGKGRIKLILAARTGA